METKSIDTSSRGVDTVSSWWLAGELLFTSPTDPFIPRVDQAVLDPAGIRQCWMLTTSDHPTPWYPPCPCQPWPPHTARTSPPCRPPKALLAGRAFSQEAETNRKVPSCFLHHLKRVMSSERRVCRKLAASAEFCPLLCFIRCQCKSLLHYGRPSLPVPLCALPYQFRKQMRNN